MSWGLLYHFFFLSAIFSLRVSELNSKSNQVSNLYVLKKSVSSTNQFTFKSAFNETSQDTARQAVFIFGRANQTSIFGMLCIISISNTCIWDGDGNVTATKDNSGLVTVTLPNTAYDRIALLSVEKIE